MALTASTTPHQIFEYYRQKLYDDTNHYYIVRCGNTTKAISWCQNHFGRANVLSIESIIRFRYQIGEAHQDAGYNPYSAHAVQENFYYFKDELDAIMFKLACC